MTCSKLPATFLVPLVIGLAAGCASAKPGAKTSDPSTVTAEDIAQRPSESIEKILQAKVSGVIVRRTSSGGVALQIRGAEAYWNENNVPLYVVNDLPVAAGPEGELPSVVDPYEIATIKVLKGADAAIYGIQGANGVIVITMKKPGEKKTP